jgi:predicted amidohydrolase YtcJ
MKQLFVLLITFTFSALVLAQAPADLVLVNGKIWTVNDKQAEIEAVAVLGNRIAAIGSTEEIRKWIGVNTRVVDLQGKRGTPGFNDSHVHFLDGGM